MVAPAEEYTAADGEPAREVALLFRVSIQEGLLHGALLMYCR